MYDVFFYEAFAEEAESLRALLPAKFSAGYTDRTIQETGHVAPPARLISIRTQSLLPVAWESKLDGVLSRSTGYDHLLEYAGKLSRPPALGYLPLYCSRAVAEQAMMVWLALMRRLPRQMRQFASFERDGLTGRESQGNTLAVVGVGHIGYEVWTIGKALGMRVLGVDIDPSRREVEYVSLDHALAEADVLVCAMDLRTSNRKYFDLAAWKKAKPGLIFVNVSRGELSPSTDLLAALDEGLLGGVGLDVFNQEAELAGALRMGVTSDDPEVLATIALSKRDDCICTPHNAFNSAQAVRRKSEHSVEQIAAFLERGAFLWSPVKMP